MAHPSLNAQQQQKLSRQILGPSLANNACIQINVGQKTMDRSWRSIGAGKVGVGSFNWSTRPNILWRLLTEKIGLVWEKLNDEIIGGIQQAVCTVLMEEAYTPVLIKE